MSEYRFTGPFYSDNEDHDYEGGRETATEENVTEETATEERAAEKETPPENKETKEKKREKKRKRRADLEGHLRKLHVLLLWRAQLEELHL